MHAAGLNVFVSQRIPRLIYVVLISVMIGSNYHTYESDVIYLQLIPNTFVKKFGAGLPQTLFLKPPNGGEWKLELEKRDGKIWFGKGWKEFAEYHSLAHGHLLLFRYNKRFHFLVHIFDCSAVEVEYPIGKVEGKMATDDEENKPLKYENLEYNISYRKRKDNSSYEFLKPRMGSGKCVKVDNTMKLPKDAPLHTDRKGKGKVITTTMAVTHTAFEKASCFKPCNPSFLIIMRPSYVHSGRALQFPSMFSKTHIDLHNNKKGDIYLQVLNGRVWPAKYLIRTVAENKRFEITTGWKNFRRDNNLNVGDVCVFELIPGTGLTFLIHIFRASHNSNCSIFQGSSVDMFY
ncbi:hypothetical protein VNO78_16078 [Psophocarpus tetragonolobus]|uniref:TF-B3 domain-containing protein n=1 Tax=Psophocarpus tetragonolobus TaxID=3891 RepID=A0AAN9XKC6_PSOTE